MVGFFIIRNQASELGQQKEETQTFYFPAVSAYIISLPKAKRKPNRCGMGNSPAMVFKHYRAVVKDKEVAAYWAIKPAQPKNLIAFRSK